MTSVSRKEGFRYGFSLFSYWLGLLVFSAALVVAGGWIVSQQVESGSVGVNEDGALAVLGGFVAFLGVLVFGSGQTGIVYKLVADGVEAGAVEALAGNGRPAELGGAAAKADTDRDTLEGDTDRADDGPAAPTATDERPQPAPRRPQATESQGPTDHDTVSAQTAERHEAQPPRAEPRRRPEPAPDDGPATDGATADPAARSPLDSDTAAETTDADDPEAPREADDGTGPTTDATDESDGPAATAPDKSAHDTGVEAEPDDPGQRGDAGRDGGVAGRDPNTDGVAGPDTDDEADAADDEPTEEADARPGRSFEDVASESEIAEELGFRGDGVPPERADSEAGEHQPRDAGASDPPATDDGGDAGEVADSDPLADGPDGGENAEADDPLGSPEDTESLGGEDEGEPFTEGDDGDPLTAGDEDPFTEAGDGNPLDDDGTDPLAGSNGTDPLAESDETDPLAESDETDPLAESGGSDRRVRRRGPAGRWTAR